jgi:hypothetical protein
LFSCLPTLGSWFAGVCLVFITAVCCIRGMVQCLWNHTNLRRWRVATALSPMNGAFNSLNILLSKMGS